MTKTSSTSTNTRVSRLLHKKSKSKDSTHLNPLDTYDLTSTSFKSESNSNIPRKNQSNGSKQNEANETQMSLKVKTFCWCNINNFDNKNKETYIRLNYLLYYNL